MNKIKELREERDMRQVDLANACFINQQTLSNYETGKTDPDIDTLIKLADFFCVSIDYLVGRDVTAHKTREEIIKRCGTIRNELNCIEKLL